MLKFWSIVSEVTAYLVWFGIPAYAFYRQPKSGERSLPTRFLVGMFGTWVGLLLHRELIGLPVALARAEARGDLNYDGVGMNAALLVFGWLFGLISSTTALLVYLCWSYFGQRQDSSP